MKLYSAPLSLFARKVEIALHEKGLAFERVMVPFSQARGYQPKHPDVLEANPKGQVPVLVDEDVNLYDSTVLDLFADEVMLVPLRALMHRTGPRPPDPARWAALEAEAKAAETVLDAHLARLERQLRDRDHFCGAFGIADISVFMAVLYSQRLGGPSLAGHHALSGWYARLRDRPAISGVASEIVAADLELSTPADGAYGGRK